MLLKGINYHIYNRFIILKTLGFSLKGISEILNISYSTIIKYNFNYNSRNLFRNKAYLGSKKEPYYKDEMQYSSIPTYNYDELSESEKEFYIDNLKLNN
jgi:hypothetical protein|tara:strand:+ start:86 stop:382 length:297 start_codon:yes stop_codon:yes gene_type:complete